jgi:hypothetical protein
VVVVVVEEDRTDSDVWAARDVDGWLVRLKIALFPFRLITAKLWRIT